MIERVVGTSAVIGTLSVINPVVRESPALPARASAHSPAILLVHLVEEKEVALHEGEKSLRPGVRLKSVRQRLLKTACCCTLVALSYTNVLHAEPQLVVERSQCLEAPIDAIVEQDAIEPELASYETGALLPPYLLDSSI